MNNELDKNFKQLIGTKMPEIKPSSRFSMNVMDKIYQLAPRMVYKPVIGKWGWLSIAAGFSFFVLYVLLNSSAGGDSFFQPVHDQLISVLSPYKPDFSALPALNISEFFMKVPMLVYLIIMAVSLLIIFDWLVTERNKKSSH